MNPVRGVICHLASIYSLAPRMIVGLILFLTFVLVVYPLVAPWRRSFIVGWMVIWFCLWIIFFARVNYESAHPVKGFFPVSALVGCGIFIFIVASLLRVIFRMVVQRRGSKE